MAEPKGKPARQIKRMSVEPGKSGGFTVEHHFQQEMGGGGMPSYKEPETHVVADHGELLNHLHEHFGDNDESETCPCCAASETPVKEGGGKKSAPEKKPEKAKSGGLGSLAKH